MTYIARNVLAGRAAMIKGRPDDAAIAFRRAAETQEAEEFSLLSDPPGWYYPVRVDLARALVAVGDRTAPKRDAEAALRYQVKNPSALALLKQLGA